LSLRIFWRGCDHQNGNNQPQVHVMGPAMTMRNPKKVTKIKKHSAPVGGRELLMNPRQCPLYPKADMVPHIITAHPILSALVQRIKEGYPRQLG
jgi:hypothetical protein